MFGNPNKGAGFWGVESTHVTHCPNSRNPAGHSPTCVCRSDAAVVKDLGKSVKDPDRLKAWLRGRR